MSNLDLLRQTITNWQNRLLQLDQRNRLLYFRTDSTSVVDLQVGEISQFLSRLERSRHGLSFPFQPAAPRQPRSSFVSDPTEEKTPESPIQPGDIETNVPVRELQGRLLRLRNKDREFTEEQGISILYLACGQLHWVDENDVRATAPLVLVPCSLDRASPRDAFFLRRSEDETLTNITLSHKLGVDLRFTLPEFDIERSIEEYLGDVSSSISDKSAWRVENSIFLATFQYSKMAMWEDLEALKQEIEVIHPLVRYLAGDDTSASQSRHFDGTEWFNREDLAGGMLDEFVRPQDLPLVMPADFSQLQTIGKAKTGNHLVVHGPPGTGKSQTIANLIGAFIHEGKSVLFVSEKTAALDVVKRRLDATGLGVFCLDMHSERGKKANVYAQLKQSLEGGRGVTDSEFDHRALLDLRRRLNSYVRALHQRREPLGLTMFQVNGMFALVRDLPDVEFTVPEPRHLTLDTLATFTDVGSRLAARAQQFETHFNSRWRVLGDVELAVGLPDDLRRRLARIDSARLAAERVAFEVASWAGVPRPKSARGLNVAVSRARRSMTVVHSLRPERIISPTTGAKWLRSFLEFARNPAGEVHTDRPAADGGDFDSDFEAAVHAALSKRGHNVRRQVGSAGFSIDLAIMSDDESRYDLGIECDGAAYHSGPAARDRDWLRQSILENLGWCIHRVWSTDWIRNPQKELDAIEEALGKCRSRATEDLIQRRPVHDADPPPHGDEVRGDENGAERLFAEYEVANLRGTRHGPDLSDEDLVLLGNLIVKAVEVEGPIHFKGLLEILRIEYRAGRMGGNMRRRVVEAIRALIRLGKVQIIPTNFLMLAGQAVRPRCPSESFRRTIEQISQAELREGLLRVSSVIQGAVKQDLINETARQFGYDRTGQDIQAAFEEAMDSLLANKTMKLSEDDLVRIADGHEPHEVQALTGKDRGARAAFESARRLAHEKKLEIIDRTSTPGGSLWVVGGSELDALLGPLGFNFAKAGGKATTGRPAWYKPS